MIVYRADGAQSAATNRRTSGKWKKRRRQTAIMTGGTAATFDRWPPPFSFYHCIDESEKNNVYYINYNATFSNLATPSLESPHYATPTYSFPRRSEGAIIERQQCRDRTGMTRMCHPLALILQHPSYAISAAF
jgi:hypothetical protein